MIGRTDDGLGQLFCRVVAVVDGKAVGQLIHLLHHSIYDLPPAVPETSHRRSGTSLQNAPPIFNGDIASVSRYDPGKQRPMNVRVKDVTLVLRRRAGTSSGAVLDCHASAGGEMSSELVSRRGKGDVMQ